VTSALNCDLHTHTKFSDGRTGIEDNVRGAKAAGLAAIAISDYLMARDDPSFSDRDALRRRAGDVRQVAAWANARVIMAVEATATDIAGHISLDDDDRAQVELALVDTGYHTAGLGDAVPAGRARQLEMILTLHERLAANPMVDVLAHPFTYGRFNLDLTLDDLPESFLRQLGARLAERGAAFEINNGVWWWWPQFHPLQLAEAYARVTAGVAAGGARFTLGSDAHCNTGVGNLGWALRVAQLAGLNDNHWAIVEELVGDHR